MPEKVTKKPAARPRRAARARRPAVPKKRPSAPAKARPKGPAAAGTLTIVQVRSGIGCNFTHKRTLRALGLRHPHQRVVRPDNPAVRGMVAAIPHLVQIVEGGNG